MKINKTWLSLVLVLIITWVVALVYESKLPEMVPTHWNMDGEVNGYTRKPWGVFMLPLISTLSSLLLMLLPKVAPKGFKIDDAKNVYQFVVLIVAIFMLCVMVLTFEAALDKSIKVGQWITAGIGVLFILIGNYLSKVPKNFFLGIRTPWTLASDEVWYKTHRMGSWVFMVCGLLAVVGSILNWHSGIMMAIMISAGLIPFAYSLWAYKTSEGFTDEEK